MEVLIMKFDGTNDADDALKEVTQSQGDRNPWIHDVGVVKRPLVGKMSIRATYNDGESGVLKQGDISSKIEEMGGLTGYLIGGLVGPLHADWAATEGMMRSQEAGKALEKMLMRTDDIKSMLPRGSSALVLVASPDINDQMVKMFSSWSPEVTRRDVAQEVRQRLQAFQQKTIQDIAQQQTGAH